MPLFLDVSRVSFAVLFGCVSSCGGESADNSQSTTQHPTSSSTGGSPSTGGSSATGGNAATGGSSATGGTAATGGFAGCANRSVVYEEGTLFPYVSSGIANLPECTPTCGQIYGTLESMPAGPCNGDPRCFVTFASGQPPYFVCSCVISKWSCFAGSGSPP